MCAVDVSLSRPWYTRAYRRVFSFPVLLASLLPVLAVFTVRARFDDPDMWWHLKIGEVIWKTRQIPSSDLFSYTTNHHAYTAHEWLSQLFMYGTYRLGGYPGLMLWLCFFTSALMIAGYVLCTLYSGNSKVAFLGALLIWFFATIGLSLRPQMIGYLFLLFELFLIQLGRTHNARWFLGLPPLFAVWVNCHGSFFLGIIVAGLFLFSSFFDFHAGSLVAVRWSQRCRRMIAVSWILSIAALFSNPVGVKQILYPLETLWHMPLSIQSIEEWQALQLNDVRGIALLGVMGSVFLLVILLQSELYLHELILLALGVWLAASHQRLLFAFGILAAPVLSRQLSALWDGYDAELDRPKLNALLIAAALFMCFRALPSHQDLLQQVEEHSPAKAVEFMKVHQLSGPMLNEYVYGGYLLWAAPEQPVFIDGRGDVFEWTGVFEEYGKWITIQGNPNELLDKYKINLCLLPRHSPVVNVLGLLHNWTMVYSDNTAVIFTRGAVGKSLPLN